MNPWEGPVSRNPYHRTAFRVARLGIEAMARSQVVEAIARTRKLVAADPRQHRLDGVPVSLAEVNRAERILLDPVRRIVEEFLEHAPEASPKARIEEEIHKLEELLQPPARPPLVCFPVLLNGILKEIVEAYLDAAPLASPSLGAFELEPVPPWGADESP